MLKWNNTFLCTWNFFIKSLGKHLKHASFLLRNLQLFNEIVLDTAITPANASTVQNIMEFIRSPPIRNIKFQHGRVKDKNLIKIQVEHWRLQSLFGILESHFSRQSKRHYKMPFSAFCTQFILRCMNRLGLLLWRFLH